MSLYYEKENLLPQHQQQRVHQFHPHLTASLSSSIANASVPSSNSSAIIRKILDNDHEFSQQPTSAITSTSIPMNHRMEDNGARGRCDQSPQTFQVLQPIRSSNSLGKNSKANNNNRSSLAKQNSHSQLKVLKPPLATMSMGSDFKHSKSRQSHQQSVLADSDLKAMNKSFHERNLSWTMAKDKRLAQTRKQNTQQDIEAETKECTFTPAIVRAVILMESSLNNCLVCHDEYKVGEIEIDHC